MRRMELGVWLIAGLCAFCAAGVAAIAWALYCAPSGEETDGFEKTGPSLRDLRRLHAEAERIKDGAR